MLVSSGVISSLSLFFNSLFSHLSINEKFNRIFFSLQTASEIREIYLNRTVDLIVVAIWDESEVGVMMSRYNRSISSSGCEESEKRPIVLAPSSDVEESDTCGDLMDKSGYGTRGFQRRQDNFYQQSSGTTPPIGHYPQHMLGLPKFDRKTRRLSDPGTRLQSFAALKISQLQQAYGAFAEDGDYNRDPDKCFVTSGKICDPRLEAIRSLSPSSASEAAGEEGEALAAPAIAYRSSRSRSVYQLPAGFNRFETRSRSMSMSGPASNSIELGEAMGAVMARTELLSSPLQTSPLVEIGEGVTPAKDESPAHALRRRRSISLECSRLEAILEENSRASRKFSLPASGQSLI